MRTIDIFAHTYCNILGEIKVPDHVVTEEEIRNYIKNNWGEIEWGDPEFDYSGTDIDVLNPPQMFVLKEMNEKGKILATYSDYNLQNIFRVMRERLSELDGKNLREENNILFATCTFEESPEFELSFSLEYDDEFYDWKTFISSYCA